MRTYEPWESVNGLITQPCEESKEPWDGDRLGPERPYIRDYSQTLTYKIMLAFQNLEDPTQSRVILRFDEALERIKEIDTMTLGLPKIVYLVGWNAMGHDDKYPSWDIVNPFLCRPGSTDPVDDLRWLMREAQRYHTSVSLHLNSSDAYKDSPLWDECKRCNIIGRRNGEDFSYGVWSNKKVYPIVYKTAWESGFYKQQIDNLLAMLPELKEAGSIHSDAFLCRWTDQSSYHEEEAARRQMIRYWRDCGIDLTSEFIYGGGEKEGEDVLGALNGNHVESSGLIGLQAYAWHLAQDEKYWFSRSASLLAGGAFPHMVNPFVLEEGYEKIAFLYGCSMHVEDILLDVFRKTEEEAEVLPDAFAKKSEEKRSFEDVFIERFYTTTAMYVYLNRFQNVDIKETDGVTVLTKADGLVATYSSDPAKRTITKNGILIRQDNDVFVPLCWKEHPAVAAFSEKGYEQTEWTLLPEWEKIREADVYIVSQDGLTQKHTGLPISEQRSITLSLAPKQAMYIIPAGNKC